jgi:hypothetical protein
MYDFFFHANVSTTLFLVLLQPPLLPPMVGFVSPQTTVLLLPSYVGNPFICLHQQSRSSWSTIYPLHPRYQCYHKNNERWTYLLLHAKVFGHRLLHLLTFSICKYYATSVEVLKKKIIMPKESK